MQPLGFKMLAGAEPGLGTGWLGRDAYFANTSASGLASTLGMVTAQEGGDGGRNREDGDFIELDPRLDAGPPGDKGCVQVRQGRVVAVNALLHRAAESLFVGINASAKASSDLAGLARRMEEELVLLGKMVNGAGPPHTEPGCTVHPPGGRAPSRTVDVPVALAGGLDVTLDVIFGPGPGPGLGATDTGGRHRLRVPAPA